MRFESLTLECYGERENLALAFPESPGLVVIFGPNEAGKSSCLEAVADFLFGVPERSPRTQLFGPERLRIGATLRRSDGTRLALRRRKGRGATLTDETGTRFDEATLAQCLGATTRDRFASLHGLNHASLREGGEHLLKSDGEIGRLILEAGGGLRSLAAAVDALKGEAAALYGPRQRGGCLYYDALKSFKEADAAAKAVLVSQERYEKAAQSLNGAQDSVAERAGRLKHLREEKSRVERLARVVPAILEFDAQRQRLAGFAEAERLGEAFAAAAQAALETRRQRAEKLAETQARSRETEERIAALAPTAALLAAAPAIEEASDRGKEIAKQRRDRRNREAELYEVSEKLARLRADLGVDADDALAARAPDQNAIDRAQALATEGLQTQARLAGLAQEEQRRAARCRLLAGRLAELRAAGRDEPLGVDATEFAELPRREAEDKQRRAQFARREVAIATRLEALGFADAERLAAWPCPDEASILREIGVRAEIDVELRRVGDRIAERREELAAAEVEAAELARAGELPTREMIETARAERDRVAEMIWARYRRGDAGAPRDERERISDVETHRGLARAADDLADRRAAGAERIAALELAGRARASAAAALDLLADRMRELEAARMAARESWRAAWPEAAARFEDPARLGRASADRAALLAEDLTFKTQIEAAALDRAGFASRLKELARIEARFGFDANLPLADRVAAARAAAKAHEDAYADWRAQREASADADRALAELVAQRAAELSAQERWRAQWEPSRVALGLDASVTLAEANRIITGWAAALGHLGTAAQIRKRLRRMDEDEAELRTRIADVAAALDFALPEDCVAAAALLSERLREARQRAARRETLEADLARLAADSDEAARRTALCDDEIAGLCARSGATPETLAALAGRCAEHATAARGLEGLRERIAELGDALSLETLRAQWAGRDLDELRAEALRLEAETQELDGAYAAGVAERERLRLELATMTATEGINAFVAERESAAAEMHDALERHVELALAEELLRAAMETLRQRRRDPLIERAGELFAASTAGAFCGVETDIDDRGAPIVLGRRAGGRRVRISEMSDGSRDQLYLAFRVASVESYSHAAEPIPFVADDLLVHFDDDRSAATLRLLAELGRATQVMLFTHHRSVAEAAARLAAEGRASLIEIA